MKKLLCALLISISLFAHAEEENKSSVFDLKKPVKCGNLKEVIDVIVKSREEDLVMISEQSANKLAITLFANSDTKTWTLIESDNETACILNYGKGLKFKIPSLKNIY